MYQGRRNEIFLGNTMRRNLLNWCNLVSISKKLMFYENSSQKFVTKMIKVTPKLCNAKVTPKI